MANINLLPEELASKTGTKKAVSSIKNSAIILFAIFFLVFSGATFYLILLSSQTNKTNTSVSSLKTTIESLQEVEQRVVLVKDRLSKVKNILGEKTATDSVEGLEIIYQFLPAGAVVTEAKLSSDLSEVSFSISNSSGLVQVLSNILASERFSNVQMKSFSYTPSTGYVVNLELSV